MLWTARILARILYAYLYFVECIFVHRESFWPLFRISYSECSKIPNDAGNQGWNSQYTCQNSEDID